MTLPAPAPGDDGERSVNPDDALWAQMCEADGLDPAKRLQARQQVLDSAEACDCTLYRSAEDDDPDTEEEDLGDARILFEGAFQAPAHWGEAELEDFFGDEDPEQFVTALIECCAAPSTAQFFTPEPGDYVAVVNERGQVTMYYLYACHEDDAGRHCVLIHDDEALL